MTGRAGDTVVLRPFVADDALLLATAIQDPEIVRWLDVAQPYTVDHACAFVGRVDGDWEERRGAHFVIERDGSFAGYLGVLAVESGMRVVEIVYWVAAEHRGHALAARALATALPWVELEIAPARIELGMKAGNAASARVATANGFAPAEVIENGAELDGRPVDEHIYVHRAGTDTLR